MSERVQTLWQLFLAGGLLMWPIPRTGLRLICKIVKEST